MNQIVEGIPYCDTEKTGRISKIIQIHPSLKCNLYCKHCYSSSAPTLKNELELGPLIKFIEQAYDLGYNVISMSGGEPFLYGGLEELVNASKSIGYFNSITSNGMLLKSARAKRILNKLDLVALSVDGKKESHDIMRSFDGAFASMMEGVKVLQDSIARFGFIHTVLPDSWKIFAWLAELALEKKASLLHLHPLEISGRAKTHFNGLTFTSEDLHKIYIAHYYLSTHFENEIFIQLDLLHRDCIIDNPNFIFHENYEPSFTATEFANIFKELIIDEKGDILPFAHGCSKELKIGNIHSNETLERMVARFMEHKMAMVMELYLSVYNEIINNTEFEIFNWSEIVINRSHMMTDLTSSVLHE